MSRSPSSRLSISLPPFLSFPYRCHQILKSRKSGRSSSPNHRSRLFFLPPRNRPPDAAAGAMTISRSARRNRAGSIRSFYQLAASNPRPSAVSAEAKAIPSKTRAGRQRHPPQNWISGGSVLTSMPTLAMECSSHWVMLPLARLYSDQRCRNFWKRPSESSRMPA